MIAEKYGIEYVVAGISPRLDSQNVEVWLEQKRGLKPATTGGTHLITLGVPTRTPLRKRQDL